MGSMGRKPCCFVLNQVKIHLIIKNIHLRGVRSPNKSVRVTDLKLFETPLSTPTASQAVWEAGRPRVAVSGRNPRNVYLRSSTRRVSASGSCPRHAPEPEGLIATNRKI